MPVLASPEMCTGCAACFNICTHSAIAMVKDEEGFLVPFVDGSKCVDCGLCENVCPALHPLSEVGFPAPKVYAMWSELDRRKSSSGGVFSAFARNILGQEGVVFGAFFDKGLHCKHVDIQSIEDLPALQGSKYVQSEMGIAFKRVKDYLKIGRKVLFSGTPCQIAGLKKYLRKSDANLLTLDLICHGVPSEDVFKGYLTKVSSRFAAMPDGYEFRKRDGWGIVPSISFCGKSRPMCGMDSLYMKAFTVSAIFRKCCYQCKYSSIPRVGDCTLGDFWGIGKYGIPFEYDTRKGVSLVLANTAQGEAALHQLTDCFVEERTLEEALMENHNLKGPSERHADRESIISDFLNPEVSLKKMATKYKLVDFSMKARINNLATRWGLFDFARRLYNWIK